jgi:hypothetical protein
MIERTETYVEASVRTLGIRPTSLDAILAEVGPNLGPHVMRGGERRARVQTSRIGPRRGHAEILQLL